MKTVDVAIIGAGPAGCAAAIELSRSSLDVLLIEGLVFPRHRPGESLHPGIEPLFEKLGVLEAVNAAGFARHRGHRVEWGSPSGSTRFESFGADERGAWLGYQAWRPDLDCILLDAATKAGATLLQPCRALHPILDGERISGIATERGHVKARFILDASGRIMWLTRKMGLGQKLHSPKLTARYGYVHSGASQEFEEPCMRRDANGWTWIARVRPGLCAWVRMRFDGVDPGADFKPSEFAFAEQTEPSQGADVTWRIVDRTAGPGWFLLGDAAASLDPAASHGVLRALMTGIQAAHLVQACCRGNITEKLATKNYGTWLERWFLADVKHLRAMYDHETEFRH